MKAAVLYPDKEPEVKQIEKGLKPLQEWVGGYIEPVPVRGLSDTDTSDWVMLVNEVGLRLGLPFNPIASSYAGRSIVGTALVLRRTPGGEFTDAPDRAW